MCNLVSLRHVDAIAMRMIIVPHPVVLPNLDVITTSEASPARQRIVALHMVGSM